MVCTRRIFTASHQNLLVPKNVFKSLLLQLSVCVFVTAGGLLIDHQLAASVLVGGAIAFLTNSWFVFIAFRSRPGDSAQKILVSFYLGSLGKFFITAGLCVLAFREIEILKNTINAAAMLLAYITIQISSWCYPTGRAS